MKGVLHYIDWDLDNWITEALERWPRWLAVWTEPSTTGGT